LRIISTKAKSKHNYLDNYMTVGCLPMRYKNLRT